MATVTSTSAAAAGAPRRSRYGGALARLLAWLDEDDPLGRRAKVDAFQLVLLLVLVTEYWCRALPKWDSLASVYLTGVAGATFCGVLALWRPTRRVAFLGLAALHAVVVWQEFPSAGNHAYLELVLCLLSALLDPDDETDRIVYVRAVRWLIIVIFFYAGLQKLLHGYYFRGIYLAFSVWIESFRPVVGLLVPSDELQRLVGLGRVPGAGPFLVSSPLLIAASNGVYLAEMGAAVLLLIPRTRALGVLVGLGIVFVIEAAAREAFFGLLFVNGIFLFPRGAVNRWLVPPVAALLFAMLLVRVGWLPDVTFY